MKKALITGLTGMDGSHLAELLLEKGYEVYGIQRRSSLPNTGRIDHIYDKLHMEYADLTDDSSIAAVISSIQPDEIYNLGAQSHVQVSFKQPKYTGDVNALGALAVLEAVHKFSPHSRVYQASTSEMFGGLNYNRPERGYNEESPFHPRSPYGVSKLAAYWYAVNYRESYNMFVCNGLLFNHSSPRRGINFVEQKIVKALVKIAKGDKTPLQIGNLYAKRDIGHAKDYVEGMYLMLQQDKPDDYVLASGETHLIKDIINFVADILKIEIEWTGKGMEEKARLKSTGNIIVEVNEKYFRPAEVDILVGDSSKARNILGWELKYDIKKILEEMVHAEFRTSK